MLPGVGKKGSVVLNLLRPNEEYKHNYGSSHCFFLFSGKGESICSRTPKRVSVCRRLVQLEVLEEPSGAQTLKFLFYLYSNTMALMQSEASAHWGWDLGTSVLSTFQA